MGGLKDRLLARLLTAFPSLASRAADKAREAEQIVFDTSPWTPVTKPLGEMTFAIVTTCGLHLKDQTPFDMVDSDGDPTMRELPLGTPASEYTITHDYYNHADADRDLNIVFPVDRMKEALKDGVIGGLTATNYGLMGHITGRHVKTLIDETAPEIARRIKAEGADAVLLTPG